MSKQKIYLRNKDLYVEIIISKSRGILTRKAEKMLELLGKRAIKRKMYYTSDDEWDCYQTGILDMYQNWYNFNERKSKNAFAYFTEIFKRATSKSFNQIYKKKGDPDNIYKTISIERSNDGNGLHSI